MKTINVVKDGYQEYRLACLESIDENIEICYNNIIVKHNFDYKNKCSQSYTHHAKRSDGAMCAVECEISDIYQMLIHGGIKTSDGTMQYLNMTKEYNIEYKENDTMIGMNNITVKTIGRQQYSTTYMVECGDCGTKQFVNTKSQFIPKCHKCAGEAHQAPQIAINELINSSSLMNRNIEDIREITFFNEDKKKGFNVKLILDSTQAKTLEDTKVGKLLDVAVLDLFEMTNKEIDKNKVQVETPDAPIKKPVATTKKAKSKITDADLKFVMEKATANFTGKSFKSRDLAPHVAEKFTARQLPSRLTKLVKAGVLEADNASPKNYTIL